MREYNIKETQNGYIVQQMCLSSDAPNGTPVLSQWVFTHLSEAIGQLLIFMKREPDVAYDENAPHDDSADFINQ